MKNIFGTIVFVFASLFQVVTAQSFEGKITMKIEYEEVPEEIEPYVGMMPKEMIMYIKDKKSRTEQTMMGGGTTTVMDSESGKGFMLMDMMGQKNAYELNANEVKEEGSEDKKPVITYFDETKEIAGYKCKKAEMKYEGEEDVVTVWYTDEITGGYNSKIQGINGQLMEYTITNNEIVMVITVSNVSKETVSDSKFDVPEGVTLQPYSELMKMGMMGNK